MSLPSRILITGGLGYLGGRIASHLLALGARVRIATRRDPAQRPPWAHAAEVVRADLIDGGDLDRLCLGIEAVIHLAAMNENDCGRDPAGCVRVNGEGSARILEAAKRANVARLVYFSTARVYREPLSGTVTETTLPRPAHPYGISHRVAEDFVLAAHDKREIAGLCLRLSNGMGAPADAGVDRWTLVLNDLCRQAATAGRLVLKSSGLQRRNFITLGDVARAVEHMLRLDAAAWGDGVFNLGGERAVPVWDMARLVAERAARVLGRAPGVERVAPAPGETHPDLDYRIDRLRATGFRLTGDYAGEIDRTLRLCRDAFGPPAQP